MPDIQFEVTHFEEAPQATYARLRVSNMDGLPVACEREFIFAKNRFLATREIVPFEESFEARLAPLWNTDNVGPQIGKHWANTFVHHPMAANGRRGMKSPPVDLLVWFAPRHRRFKGGSLSEPGPLRLTGETGKKQVFTQAITRMLPTGPAPNQTIPTLSLRPLTPTIFMPALMPRAFSCFAIALNCRRCALNSIRAVPNGSYSILRKKTLKSETGNPELPIYMSPPLNESGS